jgi:hypothetical protein
MVGQSTRKVDGGRIKEIPEINGCIEVRMRFISNTKVWVATIHGNGGGTYVPSTANADLLFTALATPWTTRLANFIHPNCSFMGVTVRDMTKRDNAEFDSTGAPHVGIATGDEMPADVTAVLTENIAKRGRGAKGRIYLSGWAENANAANGQMDPTVQTALNGLGTDWLAAMSAQGIPAVVAKPARQEYLGVTGTSHPARDAGMEPVTGYSCRDREWDTQRRRGA